MRGARGGGRARRAIARARAAAACAGSMGRTRVRVRNVLACARACVGARGAPAPNVMFVCCVARGHLHRLLSVWRRAHATARRLVHFPLAQKRNRSLRWFARDTRASTFTRVVCAQISGAVTCARDIEFFACTAAWLQPLRSKCPAPPTRAWPSHATLVEQARPQLPRMRSCE